jgi:hypothetical protein
MAEFGDPLEQRGYDAAVNAHEQTTAKMQAPVQPVVPQRRPHPLYLQLPSPRALYSEIVLNGQCGPQPTSALDFVD